MTWWWRGSDYLSSLSLSLLPPPIPGLPVPACPMWGCANWGRKKSLTCRPDLGCLLNLRHLCACYVGVRSGVKVLVDFGGCEKLGLGTVLLFQGGVRACSMGREGGSWNAHRAL